MYGWWCTLWGCLSPLFGGRCNGGRFGPLSPPLIKGPNRLLNCRFLEIKYEISEIMKYDNTTNHIRPVILKSKRKLYLSWWGALGRPRFLCNDGKIWSSWGAWRFSFLCKESLCTFFEDNISSSNLPAWKINFDIETRSYYSNGNYYIDTSNWSGWKIYLPLQEKIEQQRRTTKSRMVSPSTKIDGYVIIDRYNISFFKINFIEKKYVYIILILFDILPYLYITLRFKLPIFFYLY